MNTQNVSTQVPQEVSAEVQKIIDGFQNDHSDLEVYGKRLRSLSIRHSRGVKIFPNELSRLESHVNAINKKIEQSLKKLAIAGVTPKQVKAVCLSKVVTAVLRIQNKQINREMSVRLVDVGMEKPQEGLFSFKFLLGKCLCGLRAGDSFTMGVPSDPSGVQTITIQSISLSFPSKQTGE